MENPVAPFVLLPGLIWLATLPCLAQGKPACDFLSKSEAAAILDATVDTLPGDGLSQCRFGEIGFTGRAPKIKQVSLSVSSSASPNADAFAVARQGIANYQQCLGCPPPPVLRDISDLGDAAVWGWYAGLYGVLYAFKAGTIQVQVVIQGIPEDSALQNAKALAAKALGGTSRSGYVYAGTPNSKPAVDARVAGQNPVPGGKVFSEARYLTYSQFLHGLKEVSIVLDSAAVTKYMSRAEQTDYVSKALAAYGIAVRQNAPVSLLVTVDYQPFTIRETTERGPFDANIVQDRHTHMAFVSLDFFVRSAVLRHGKIHLVMASPVSRYNMSGWKGGTDVGQDLKEWIAENLQLTLQQIASDEEAETAQWNVNSWSAAEKQSANAEVSAMMRPQSPVDKHPYEDVNGEPKLNLIPSSSNDKNCVVDPSWRDYWVAAFERLGWTQQDQQPALTVKQQFYCSNEQIQYGPNYFMILDIVSLSESNAVFQLNGQFFRRPALLISSKRMTSTLPRDLDPTLQRYFRQSVSETLTEFVLGSRTFR